LAGHVHVEDHAIISPLSGVHHSAVLEHTAWLVEHSSCQGCSSYTLAQGNSKLFGLNLIGLKRRNFSEKSIKAITQAYRIIFARRSPGCGYKKVESEVDDLPEVRNLIKFIKESERGICR